MKTTDWPMPWSRQVHSGYLVWLGLPGKACLLASSISWPPGPGHRITACWELARSEVQSWGVGAVAFYLQTGQRAPLPWTHSQKTAWVLD